VGLGVVLVVLHLALETAHHTGNFVVLNVIQPLPVCLDGVLEQVDVLR
jgi:hypothetical protein